MKFSLCFLCILSFATCMRVLESVRSSISFFPYFLHEGWWFPPSIDTYSYVFLCHWSNYRNGVECCFNNLYDIRFLEIHFVHFSKQKKTFFNYFFGIRTSLYNRNIFFKFQCLMIFLFFIFQQILNSYVIMINAINSRKTNCKTLCTMYLIFIYYII